MTEDMTVCVRCVLKRLTPRAALLDIDGDEEWVPLSAIEDVLAASQVGCSINVEIYEWKARQLNLF